MDKVPAIIGPNWAEFAEVASPLAENYKVPLITPSGHREGMFKGTHYSFTLFPSQDVNVKPLVELLKKSSYGKMSVLITPTAYTESLYSSITRGLINSQIQLAEPIVVSPDTTDFQSVVTKIKNNND